GPWTPDVLKTCHGSAQGKQLRLVKGSHLVVPRLYEGEHAYILQNDDARIVFVIPYQQDFTLIGTTEVKLGNPPDAALDISKIEAEYLCESTNAYFKKQISPSDAVHTFAGVRPLFDDEAEQASKITREYVLDLDVLDGAPVLSIFGGKLTTYRQLAEKAMKHLAPYFPNMGPSWTATSTLPGGEACAPLKYSGIDEAVLKGLQDRHGSLADQILDGATSMADLGAYFGNGLTAREVDYMVRSEWAKTVDDILWRRSKLGLYFSQTQQDALAAYLKETS
ncbi:MAG: FAD-dependent oxidoreductase, partial [Magnetovibrio sp.]|nr:FAD-dependent oxidoreductase [Magnetovibrio sp.]